MFGQPAANTSLFGQQPLGFGNVTSNLAAGDLFGLQAKKPTTSFGQGGGLFGNANNNTTTLGGLFGQKPATGFGTSNTSAGGLFGGNTAANTGAAANTNSTANNATSTTGTGLFGNNAQKPAGGLFGSTTAPSLFGQSNNNANTTNANTNANANTNSNATNSGGLFGGGNNNTGSTGLFGNTSGGLFGANTSNTNTANATNSSGAATTGGLFGNNSNTNTGTGLFGNNANSGGLFGSKPAAGGLFGSSTQNATQNTTQNSGSLFGNSNATQSSGLFGNSQPAQNSGGLFNNNNNNKGLFGLQQQQQQQQQQQPQLTAMTLVGDLAPAMKTELEQFDKYIETQHLTATTLQADLKKQDQLIKSIPTDVDYLHTKVSAIKQALTFDTSQLKKLKAVNDELTQDIGNVMQLIVQLLTPGTKLLSSYHLNEFFMKRIKKYLETLEAYEGVIRDSERAIAGLNQACNETLGSIYDVIAVVKSQHALFMELCETLAQVHNEVLRLTSSQ